MAIKYKFGERITVDYDSESYMYGDSYFESWDNFGEELADEINNLLEQAEAKPLDLHKDFQKWTNYISDLHTDEQKLYNLKQERDKKKQEILTTFDFQKEYGKNNEDIRNGHLKKVMQPTHDKINSLELKISDAKRQISLLKRLTQMKIELIKYDK